MPSIRHSLIFLSKLDIDGFFSFYNDSLSLFKNILSIDFRFISNGPYQLIIDNNFIKNIYTQPYKTCIINKRNRINENSYYL